MIQTCLEFLQPLSVNYHFAAKKINKSELSCLRCVSMSLEHYDFGIFFHSSMQNFFYSAK